MPYQSLKQPLCRWCAKPIRKWTRYVYLKEAKSEHHRPDNWCSYLYPGDAWPRSKYECQRLVNDKVVSIQRHNGQIVRFTTWDGSSYYDLFFCCGGCAEALGYHAARDGLASKEWRAANFVEASK